MIIDYLGDEPLTLSEVKLHCRIDTNDENDLISNVIIPSARALAEAKTGCAIREARYSDEVQDLGAVVLSMGGVTEVESVVADGISVEDYVTRLVGRRTELVASGYTGKPGTVTYVAGVEVAKYPSVKAWLLLAAGWIYANRELLQQGQAIQEIPRNYVDAMLAPIDVPAAM